LLQKEVDKLEGLFVATSCVIVELPSVIVYNSCCRLCVYTVITRQQHKSVFTKRD